MEHGKQRQIARKGGMAAHLKGTAHEFSPEEARNAGRKGGQSVSLNRAHMIEIGRLGGKRSAERRRASARAAQPGDQPGRQAGEPTRSQSNRQDRTDPDIPGAEMGDEMAGENRMIPPGESQGGDAHGQNAAP